MAAIEEWVDIAHALSKENTNLKAALKEFIRGEQAKLIDGSKLGPFIESFLKRHNLKVEDFLP